MEAAHPSLGTQNGLLNSRQNRILVLLHAGLGLPSSINGKAAAPIHQLVAVQSRSPLCSQREGHPRPNIKGTRSNPQCSWQPWSYTCTGVSNASCLRQVTHRSVHGMPSICIPSLQASPRVAGNCSGRMKGKSEPALGEQVAWRGGCLRDSPCVPELFQTLDEATEWTESRVITLINTLPPGGPWRANQEWKGRQVVPGTGVMCV